jgi:hypothetical protein
MNNPKVYRFSSWSVSFYPSNCDVTDSFNPAGSVSCISGREYSITVFSIAECFIEGMKCEFQISV